MVPVFLPWTLSTSAEEGTQLAHLSTAAAITPSAHLSQGSGSPFAPFQSSDTEGEVVWLRGALCVASASVHTFGCLLTCTVEKGFGGVITLKTLPW